MPFLDPGPVPRPTDWLEHVNRPANEKELERIRQSVNRSSPFGGDMWVKRTAADLGLESTLRGPGRPRKRQEKEAQHATLFAEE
jgi:hypothetical protein